MTSFSIIMPSYLGAYKNAAKNRDQKIVRAIHSCLNQTYKDFELIVIADGCQKTVEIVKSIKHPDKHKLRLFHIEKQPLWSGRIRNTGIINASKEWIVYCDIDDMLGKDHLKIINDEIESKEFDLDWVYFHDLSYDTGRETFVEHFININTRGQCGTSNVAHKRVLNVRWVEKGDYLHDWYFIQDLKKLGKHFTAIRTPEYCVCHVPSLLDI